MPSQKNGPTVAEPQGVQNTSPRLPQFPYVVMHRDPRTNGMMPVAIFLYRAHAGAFMRGLEITNPDAVDQFELREINYD
ncbi:hypothetical protein IQ254_10680 [Nodosilinea sp. LEGE 07088]|uniref:hypothetical protein n=1 Tax=Nodosilinea sp. LEGE 07088 TaxID=2777968 RepID=UPI001880A38B|nr:hypothetical protein [Nodosilinea sp. LEGE 07088]MBE9137674.1 hypothetical protein [Nodosilinea sp. LEGE 07088]